MLSLSQLDNLLFVDPAVVELMSPLGKKKHNKTCWHSNLVQLSEERNEVA